MRAGDLDDNLAAPARLAVMASLYPGAPLSFRALKLATGLADGNLHVQTRHLAEAGYVTIRKTRRDAARSPPSGSPKKVWPAFAVSCSDLQAVLDDDSGAIHHPPARPGTVRPLPGLVELT